MKRVVIVLTALTLALGTVARAADHVDGPAGVGRSVGGHHRRLRLDVGGCAARSTWSWTSCATHDVVALLRQRAVRLPHHEQQRRSAHAVGRGAR